MGDDPLTYIDDVRVEAPEENHRLGRFKVGWNDAVDDEEYDAVLDELTWQNLGWRLGKLFGETSEELQEEMYDWCVQQQTDDS